LRELRARSPGPLLPSGDLVEVISQVVALPTDPVKRCGELSITDLVSGVSTDDPDFFEV
jgi:hypothetical protein